MWFTWQLYSSLPNNTITENANIEHASKRTYTTEEVTYDLMLQGQKLSRPSNYGVYSTNKYNNRLLVADKAFEVQHLALRIVNSEFRDLSKSCSGWGCCVFVVHKGPLHYYNAPIQRESKGSLSVEVKDNQNQKQSNCKPKPRAYRRPGAASSATRRAATLLNSSTHFVERRDYSSLPTRPYNLCAAYACCAS